VQFRCNTLQVVTFLAMAELLEVDNLRMRFRTGVGFGARFLSQEDDWIDAVLDVSFKMTTGQTIALVGESGSGKTTLGRTIIGLLQPQEGSIKFQGTELVGLGDRDYKPYRRNIGMMFQDPVASLSPRRSVRAQILEPFQVHKYKEQNMDMEVKRLMSVVGLPERFEGRFPHELSGGQARRVGVARALALSPKIIIADEPTAGLDVSVQGEVLNLMRGLQSQFSISYLVITHNLPVVRHTSDRIAIMYLGRFVEQGSTQSIFNSPAHPYTQALLGAVPKPDPKQRRKIISIEGEVPSLRLRPDGCDFHPRCKYAQARCRSEPPGETKIGSEHTVRCHFPISG